MRRTAMALTYLLSAAAMVAVGATTLQDRAEPAITEFTVTAYCPCDLCCGKWADVPMADRTVGGRRLADLLTELKPFVAAPAWLPRGTMVSVPGYAGGRPVPVLDRGDLADDQIDVFIPNHDAARLWGRRRLKVTVYVDQPTAADDVLLSE